MRTIVVTATVAAMVLGGTAVAQTGVAQTGVAPAGDAAPVPVKKKERRICRASADTGSHMTTSTCHTATEWQAIDSMQTGAGGEKIRGSRSGG